MGSHEGRIGRDIRAGGEDDRATELFQILEGCLREEGGEVVRVRKGLAAAKREFGEIIIEMLSE